MSDKNKPKKKLLPKFDVLREIETKSLTLFESFHDIILMLDRMGNIININRRGEQLTGYLQSELLKMNVFQDLLVSEDHAIIRQVFQDAFNGRESGYEVRWTTKEGKIIRFDGLTVPLLSAHGEVLSTLCTLRNITARKLAEGALRKAQVHTESILASVSDNYILFDRQWRYIYVNDAAVRAIC